MSDSMALDSFQSQFFGRLLSNGVSRAQFPQIVKQAEAQFGPATGQWLREGLVKLAAIGPTNKTMPDAIGKGLGPTALGKIVKPPIPWAQPTGGFSPASPGPNAPLPGGGPLGGIVTPQPPTPVGPAPFSGIQPTGAFSPGPTGPDAPLPGGDWFSGGESAGPSDATGQVPNRVQAAPGRSPQAIMQILAGGMGGGPAGIMNAGQNLTSGQQPSPRPPLGGSPAGPPTQTSGALPPTGFSASSHLQPGGGEVGYKLPGSRASWLPKELTTAGTNALNSVTRFGNSAGKALDDSNSMGKFFNTNKDWLIPLLLGGLGAGVGGGMGGGMGATLGGIGLPLIHMLISNPKILQGLSDAFSRIGQPSVDRERG